MLALAFIKYRHKIKGVCGYLLCSIQTSAFSISSADIKVVFIFLHILVATAVCYGS